MTMVVEMDGPCRHFGECGGCSLQDQEYKAQLKLKERRLHSYLADMAPGGICEWLPTISTQPWAYRHRVRLSVRQDSETQSVIIGFHHVRRRREVVDLDQCPIMASPLENLLSHLRSCLEAMETGAAIPQIEMIAAENGNALIIRLRHHLGERDRAHLCNFASARDTHIFLQDEGPESMRPLRDHESFQPCYHLPEFDLTFHYPVTQFAQVNPAVNREMVHSVLGHLEPQEGEFIADLYCGAGNFALAAARRGAQVSGWEWSQSSVDCARKNAESNDLKRQVSFYRDDLDRASQEKCERLAGFDKFVLDPPRSGAEALMHCLPNAGKRRVVYVSCQPKTLARDAAILVHQKGYRLMKAGLIDMFPQTEHLEALAVFEHS